MRKILAPILILLTTPLCAVEQTPDQIKASAATTFTANGVGAITGPNVGTAVTNIADSFIPRLYATPNCYWKSNGLGVSASCDGTFSIVPFSEAVAVTAPNVLAGLSHTPNGSFFMLIVNGQTLLSVGGSPPFTVGGTTVSWNSTNAGYSLATTDTVVAVYTYN